MSIVRYSKESNPECIITGSVTVHWYIEVYYWKQQIPKLLLEESYSYVSPLLTMFLIANPIPKKIKPLITGSDLTAKHNSGNVLVPDILHTQTYHIYKCKWWQKHMREIVHIQDNILSHHKCYIIYKHLNHDCAAYIVFVLDV
jgi:hypothetical protein